MNAKERLAAALKETKGLGGDASSPSPHSSAAAGGDRSKVKRPRRPRFPGLHEFAQLRAALNEQTKRAARAERALAALRARTPIAAELVVLGDNITELKRQNRKIPGLLRRIDRLWRRCLALQAKLDRRNQANS
jgi:hypothetical protein